MAEPEEVASALDALVGAGRLVGYVCGVREDGRSRIIAGGADRLGGSALSHDAVFALSSNTKPVAGVLAMRLVELGVLELDEPVFPHLPELAQPVVLADPAGPLGSTVPAEGPVTLRHLLTMTAGFGWAAGAPALAAAMAEQEVAPGPYAPPIGADEFMRRLSALPLVDQPGRGWYYHTCSDVLSVLIARAGGRSAGDQLREHITGPLGLRELSFLADAARMPTGYGLAPGGGMVDLGIADRFAGPPPFESLACGLVSTVGDYLEFLEVLVDGGPVLGADSVRLLTGDQLTEHQRRTAQDFLGPGCGYGFQVEVRPGGEVGWAGGLGTIGYVDRARCRSAAVFTAQSFEVPGTEEALDQVWALLAD